MNWPFARYREDDDYQKRPGTLLAGVHRCLEVTNVVTVELLASLESLS